MKDREVALCVAALTAVFIYLFSRTSPAPAVRLRRPDARPLGWACQGKIVASDCTLDEFCIPKALLRSQWAQEFEDRLQKDVGYEPLTGRLLNGLVLALPKGSVVFEAGLHVGDDFLVLAKTAKRRRSRNLTFIGVEPDLSKVEFVRGMLAANKLDDVAVVVHGALGAQPGSGALDRSGHAGGWTVRPQGAAAPQRAPTRNAAPRRAAPTRAPPAAAEFQLFTVDSLLGLDGETPRKLGLLHLDVEGDEYSALRGAKRALAAGDAAVLVETAHGDAQSLIPPYLAVHGYAESWTAEHNALYLQRNGGGNARAAAKLRATAHDAARAAPPRRAAPQSRQSPQDDDDDRLDR
ncbi:hypothetical protein M885DRAFT_524833 [Pelagophyceae sp. CCMP2097]|nr:hypothetical protein M885DRAFT_524833 [Pelagophyceae sp. CCMP2097]